MAVYPLHTPAGYSGSIESALFAEIMTARRQILKTLQFGSGRGPILGLLLAVLVLAPAAATTERIVTDPATGLALGGIDPVAYFVDGKPLFGDAQVEASYDGVTWRFRNEGNRAAFRERPDIYLPRFGGYDPVAVAREVGTAGNPLTWLLHGGRLYLFYDEAARAAFVADPERILAQAERLWPQVLRTLSP
jgi:YHS domain-containing protein